MSSFLQERGLVDSLFGTFEALAHAQNTGSFRPPGRMEVLRSSAHFPMWDEPDAFTDAVQGFLNALP